MSEHVASTRTKLAEAHIYHSPPGLGVAVVNTYYFCCKTCGNCGRRWTAVGQAQEEAQLHVMNHPIPEGS